MELIKKEFIFDDPVPTPECHASTIIKLDNGDLIAAWFAGEKEGKNDVMIWGSRCVNGVWSKPEVRTPEAGIPHWNPVLFKKRNGEIVLFYKLGYRISDWKTMTTVTKDGGLTWSAPAEMVPGDVSGGRGPVKNKAVRLSNGRVLAPGSVERGPWRSFIDMTNDGRSWPKKEIPVTGNEPEKINMIQPAIWEYPKGHVHVMMRTNQCRIFRSDSDDYGNTWCPAYPINMPSNNSGIDCVITENNTLILICNPVPSEWGKRSPLSVFTSEDNGETFEKQLDLEHEEGEFSYPAVITDGHRLHITYTWNRKKIVYCEIRM